MKISNGVNKQSGSGLIFAVVLLFVILGMVVTLSSITVLETKMNQKTKSSVGAFYNSESGVEWALNKIATTTYTDINSTFNTATPGSGVQPSGGADYKVYLLKADGKVIIDPSESIANIKAVRSVGTQGGETQRAIEAAVASDMGDYQTSCFANGDFGRCCIINVKTGGVKCKFYESSKWQDYPTDPWIAAPEASGTQYSLSCFELGAYGRCCRLNTKTKEENCKTYISPSGWADYETSISW